MAMTSKRILEGDHAIRFGRAQELYPERYKAGYDRKYLIKMIEQNVPKYPFVYMLTDDQVWVRNQIWKSLIRNYYWKCVDYQTRLKGRIIKFESKDYIGFIPELTGAWYWDDSFSPSDWNSDLIDAMCSAYGIKGMAEEIMWKRYDTGYFVNLAIGFPTLLPNQIPLGAEFDNDLINLRNNPPRDIPIDILD